MIFRINHAIRANLSLMFHRNVHYLDTIISRCLLETAATGLSFVTIYLLLYLQPFLDDILMPVYDPFLLAAGWLLTAWLGFGVALTLAGITIIYPVTEWFVGPLMYITLPLTGLFFMISWLPANLAYIISYSPLANCFELFRDGYFGHKVEAQWDVVYVIKCNIVMTALGLLSIRKARGYILTE